jgi:hypothetical protein
MRNPAWAGFRSRYFFFALPLVFIPAFALTLTLGLGSGFFRSFRPGFFSLAGRPLAGFAAITPLFLLWRSL